VSYTIGIKRRFIPGYTKYRAVRHSWENFRFLVDLEDGSQLVIPGFRAEGLKVYPDFKTHIQDLESRKRLADFERAEQDRKYHEAIERERVAGLPRQAQPLVQHVEQQPWLGDRPTGIAHQPPVQAYQDKYQQTYQPSAEEVEAKRRASEHVQRILGGDGPSAGLAPRSSLS
jgi:hypothetical protein